MKHYATEQRKILLAFLREHPDRQYSIQEIADRLCADEAISVSSIYRNINKMIKDASVRRVSADGTRRFLYQYIGGNCSNHIHLKCECCGQIFHMNDHAAEVILSSVLHNDAFHVDISKTILYGSCKDCE